MKKLLLILSIISGLISCAKDEYSNTGSIYGVVTVKETAEPMRATGVELYFAGSLLLKTVTYDDGHYEFEHLSAGEYELKVVASDYAEVEYRVIVESGRTARADMQLEHVQTYMTVRTLAATDIGNNNATLNGVCKYHPASDDRPSEIGFVYSTTPTPSNRGTKVTCTLAETFSCEIINLKKGTYYYQAYAKNRRGTEYGEVHTFEISGKPIVITSQIANITKTTATLNGSIEYAGDPAYTERGFVYSSSYLNPTVDDPATATTKVIVPGTSKEFSANIVDLTGDTPYYVRAYAKHSTGTEYGNVVKFITLDGKPLVVTWGTTNITATTATLNGSIEFVGDPAYTERGFVYSSSSPDPTVDDPETVTTKVIVPGTSTEFSANITGLTGDTFYYVRAYAKHSTGTAYGNTIGFSDREYFTLTSERLMVHKTDISSSANWESANNLCKSSRINGWSDWRLPTLGECKVIYPYREYLRLKYSSNMSYEQYWTSENYYSYSFYSNQREYGGYGGYCRVRCVRTIK